LYGRAASRLFAIGARLMVMTFRRSCYGLLFRTGKSGKQQRKEASPLSMIDDSGMPLRDAINDSSHHYRSTIHVEA